MNISLQSLKIGLYVSVVPTLLVYFLSGSILASIVISMVLIFYFYKYNEHNKDRKESLNILLGDNKLHFMLSDDDFLDIPLDKNQNISEVITNTVKKEMPTIRQMVDKICLINIQDEQLQNRLNSLIIK